MNCGADKRELLESDQKARTNGTQTAPGIVLRPPPPPPPLGLPAIFTKDSSEQFSQRAIMMAGMFMDRPNSFCLLGKPLHGIHL